MRRKLALTSASLSGLILGHWAAYVLYLPSSSARAELLKHTGHSWYSSALPIAVATLFAGLVLSYSSGKNRRLPLRVHAMLQVAAYLSVEIQERALSGHSFSSALSEILSSPKLLILGLLMQVLAVFAARKLVKTVSDFYDKRHCAVVYSREKNRVSAPVLSVSSLAHSPLLPRAPPSSFINVV
jgi:hypothetical protein